MKERPPLKRRPYGQGVGRWDEIVLRDPKTRFSHPRPHLVQYVGETLNDTRERVLKELWESRSVIEQAKRIS